MKIYPTILSAILLFQIIGCTIDVQPEFASGTFTNSAVGNYGKADDTLIVEPSEGNGFFIHRRTGYNTIENGKIGNRQYEKEEWTAVYDESTKTLIETRKGRHIAIYPDSGYLMIGKRKYRKK